MGKGISYGGDVVETGSGKMPRDAVQFVCSDPNFLEKAAAKKPNLVLSFLKGVYSHPRDWWVGIIWCLMSLGAFGAEAKENADGWGRNLETILILAKNNPTLAARMLVIYLKHKAMNEPEFYGRIAGGMFTNYASTGGRLGRRILPTTVKLGSSAANFVLATTGAMILSIKYGGKDIISALDAAITGDYSPDVSNEQYKEIFRSALESDVSIPQAEQDALVEIIDGVLDCIHNPGKYLGSTEKGTISQQVPVGRVSSARPDGQFGSIPQGSETNALDVISEKNQHNQW
ncbi:hypothetical protein HGO34_01625 [Agrobacterium vitis]|uniref:Uncharacterized protein n=1 Tax=Agrobacterium vitis TaxID=373 RepID=A0AAE4W989_AGRVI|nr:hypothetical protein [Agrobacterium vitis]MCF1498468.1 hypothetical protein [Allorhizobium sp. Av2]MCM2438414.1 hypothetical protein [Agrobacterium vitis]MUZ56204.1 hypothetical protein [Agrobacterium vitis]MVA64659.1 hypothetical protein [Agrobacterium vitis]MVA85630.1 hypothetical protein [Agrobacterium vitis]